MLKKILKVVSLIVIPFIVIISIFSWYDQYLDDQISKRYNSVLGRTYAVDEMNKGIKILEHNAQKDDLIILGSSELDSKVPENPQNMFPNTELNCDVDLSGRAHVQSLLDSIKVGALSNSFKDKKIVLIVSLQWFLEKEINKNGFKANFSEIQFYKFMNNKNLKSQSKLYVCNRVESLLKNDSTFERPYLYSRLNKNSNIVSNVVSAIVSPYYKIRERFLEVKDKHNALKKIKEFESFPKRDPVDINWEESENTAEKLGKEECTNNDFYVFDEYYTTYLSDQIKKLKNSTDENLNLCESKELDDYNVLLDIFKQSGVKPYIVFTSTNGYYYDYIGLNQDKRNEFYDRLGELTDEYGFDYLDLRDKEYTPYFYRDVMHLGRKGWLYVDKQITKYYSQISK